MKRVLTALVLIPAVVALIVRAPGWLLFLAVAGVAGLALREYLDLAGRIGPLSSRALTYLVGLALCLAAWQRPAGLLVGVGVGAALLLASVVVSRENYSRAWPGVATCVLGLVYVVLPFAFLLTLRTEPSGHKLVLLGLVLTWVGDAAAYYVGRAFGRRKLAPRLSPGKTIEGAMGSLAATLAAGYWLVRERGWFPGATPVDAWLLPLMLSLAAQVGDLVESALKRAADVKDSSDLLPGHGGMLDRVDALLLALPMLWYYYFYGSALFR